MKNIKSFTEVRRIGQELVSISKLKKHKYLFRENYVEQIIDKWKEVKSKKQIHFRDLPDHYKLKFKEEYDSVLTLLLSEIRSYEGLDTIKRKYKVNFYLVEDYLKRKTFSLTIKTLKKLISFLKKKRINFSISILEKNIISISPGKKAKNLCVNGLPLKLSRKKWANIIGIILDTCIKKEFIFASIDENLAEEVRTSLITVGIDPYFKRKKETFIVKGHSVIRDILTISGIDTRKKQIFSNLCLPPWIFKTCQEYQAILLAKFLDTEGSVEKQKRMIRFSQCINLTISKENCKFISRNSKMVLIKPTKTPSQHLIFNNLNNEFKKNVLKNPPLILISIQLLLRLNMINSNLYPLRISVDSKNNVSCLWNLHIQTNQDLQKFHKLCAEYITISYKKEELETLVKNSNRDCIPKKLRTSFYLLHAKNIQNIKGYFTILDLIKTTKKTKKTVYNAVSYLKNIGLINHNLKRGHTKLRKITLVGEKYLQKKTISLKEFNQFFIL